MLNSCIDFSKDGMFKINQNYNKKATNNKQARISNKRNLKIR